MISLLAEYNQRLGIARVDRITIINYTFIDSSSGEVFSLRFNENTKIVKIHWMAIMQCI
jgi:hypothetical protein